MSSQHRKVDTFHKLRKIIYTTLSYGKKNKILKYRMSNLKPITHVYCIKSKKKKKKEISFDLFWMQFYKPLVSQVAV